MSIFHSWKNTRQSFSLLKLLKLPIKSLCFFFNTLITSNKIKNHGRVIAFIYDFFAVIFAFMLANLIWVSPVAKNSSEYLKLLYDQSLLADGCLILIIQLLLFRQYGLYRGFWRFASIQDLVKIINVSILGSIIVYSTFQLHAIYFLQNKPSLLITIFYFFFLLMFLSSARVLVRGIKDYKHLYQDSERVIIVGAGNAGESLVRELLRNENHNYKPVAFVDDDKKKLGREIHNVRVWGNIVKLFELIKKFDVNLVFIAIPSASSARIRTVVDMCDKANVPCYTLPNLSDIANGRVSIKVLRHVSLIDLLGRNPITYQWDFIKQYLKGKTILITGGGGSIGSELCRQIISLGEISQLIIIDNNEYNLYAIDMELKETQSKCQILPILLSVTDKVGIKNVLKKYQPNMVFHAAAYKHVPLLEDQPRPAIFNNLMGTQYIAEASANANVETFVLISSDKAVNPTNIMGATKRAAEYFCQNLNGEISNTKFITVRFGNVLNSVGSVIPRFKKQIEDGGPVTVTHPEIMRYFMTIPEASQLILQAAFLGEGGEIFVLDMGDPIRISYLAEQMIKLAGKVIDKDIKIIYTGLRPGEKLYEECFYSTEKLQPTSHSKILRARSKRRNFNEIVTIFNELSKATQAEYIDENALLEGLVKLVPEYTNLRADTWDKVLMDAV